MSETKTQFLFFFFFLRSITAVIIQHYIEKIQRVLPMLATFYKSAGMLTYY